MIVYNGGGSNSYVCELCGEEYRTGLVMSKIPIGWATIATKYDHDNHLCPKCWEPVVPTEDRRPLGIT